MTTMRFIEAIHEQSPNGEWVMVQHHPNGDWSVSPTSISKLQKRHDAYWRGLGDICLQVTRQGRGAFEQGWNACLDRLRRIAAEAIHEGEFDQEPAQLWRLFGQFVPASINLDNDNLPDDTIVPIDVSLGELRAIREAMAQQVPA